MKKQILIAEDNIDINNLLAEILRREGYSCVQAWSGTEAEMQFLQNNFSLMLLDLMMPGRSGEELIPRLKAVKNTPIIVISAKDNPKGKADVLRSGADDYLTKPFAEEELLARIELQLRRVDEPSAQSALSFGGLQMDRDLRSVTLNGEPLNLTAREFDILELFMMTPKKVFTKENIYQSVWNDAFLGDDNTVNVHISNLRSKLGKPSYIKTVWGIGFRLEIPVD